MTRYEEAQAAVGRVVVHRKKGSRYRVETASKDMIYLKALSKGARSTEKWIGRLALDYSFEDQLPDAAHGSSKEE